MTEKNLRELTLSELIVEYDRVFTKRDNQLVDLESSDYDGVDLFDVAYELRCRLNIEELIEPAVKEGLRQARVKQKRGLLTRTLIRIGLTSVTHEGDLPIPFHVSPARMWRFLARHEPWFGVFHNSPAVIKWLEGRWLPRRWGVRFIGLEFGDRGSSIARQDKKRVSLFRREASAK